MEFSVVRLTFSEPRISNQRDDTVRSSDKKSNFVQILFIVFNNRIQVKQKVGDQYMRFEMHTAGKGDENAIRSSFDENV